MHIRISEFPIQLKEALDSARSTSINIDGTEIQNVYISGMGGSGIGGQFVREVARDSCRVPITIGKGYNIPAWVGKGTLFIASSYSGNTEETMAALEKACVTESKIVVISSGGKALEFARNKGYDSVALKPGASSPRSCLGYSIVAQLGVLCKIGLISEITLDRVKASIDLLKYDQDDIKKIAQNVAEKLYKRTPVIYVEDRMEASALRLRQQINENAKMLCWHNVIPEMNHNELVGWKFPQENIAVVFLRNRDDSRRNAVRMDININHIQNLADPVIELYSKGNSHIEKSFYFIHLGDWISWFLSELNGVDAVEIEAIDHLKSELGKL